MKRQRCSTTPSSPDRLLIRQMAWFRYQLRQFLRFSEEAARACGATPQQHQLLLGVAGYTGRGWATVSELAEFLQERHNGVVMLIERALKNGFVSKEHGTNDRRFIHVKLTRKGERLLDRLTTLPEQEVHRVRAEWM